MTTLHMEVNNQVKWRQQETIKDLRWETIPTTVKICTKTRSLGTGNSKCPWLRVKVKAVVETAELITAILETTEETISNATKDNLASAVVIKWTSRLFKETRCQLVE